MLSIKDECTFRFSKFLIIGLCNSLANFWFCIKTDLYRVAKVSQDSRVTAPPEILARVEFLSKNL